MKTEFDWDRMLCTQRDLQSIYDYQYIFLSIKKCIKRTCRSRQNVLVGFVAAQHLVFYCSVCSPNNDFSLPLWYLQTFLIPVWTTRNPSTFPINRGKKSTIVLLSSESYIQVYIYAYIYMYNIVFRAWTIVDFYLGAGVGE